MNQQFYSYREAADALEINGGYLLKHNDNYDDRDPESCFVVTDDEDYVSDLRGPDFISKCQSEDVWDETLLC